MGPQPEKGDTTSGETESSPVHESPNWESICSYCSYSFDLDNVDGSAKKVVENLRPDLVEHLKKSSLKVQELSGGISNRLLLVDLLSDVNLPKKERDRILIRVYGEETDKIIDRQAEVRTLITLQENQCAGRLYGVFDNGMCYEHVPGQTLTADSIRDPHISRLIVREIVRLHCIYQQPKDHPAVDLFSKMENMYEQISREWENKDQGRRFKEYFTHPEQFLAEIKEIREYIKSPKVKSPIVFCHNDLLCGNILYDKEEDRVHFIDFEYAGLNYQAYDLANYFNEFAGVEDCSYDRFPSKEFQIDFLKQYLENWDKAHNRSANTPISPDRIHELYVNVNKFTVVSHLFWILWACFQAKNSKIDFDFLAYARIRYDEYFTRKREWLSD
ncbi:ethanolamine kinase 1-like isoform X2 [Paramacrobiotus metropolitanus]|nr:ethanolamine kinase 1-like isoform X2 [Paramacrobiotus metropolitanus]